jgi:hypothetical protein
MIYGAPNTAWPYSEFGVATVRMQPTAACGAITCYSSLAVNKELLAEAVAFTGFEFDDPVEPFALGVWRHRVRSR